MLAALGVYVLIFCLMPLARLAGEIFDLGLGEGLDLIAEMVSSRAVQRATFNTLEAGLAATAISVGLGTAMALIVALTDIRAKTFLVFLLVLPLLIPAQISALAWLELLGPTSPLYDLPGLSYTPGTPHPLYSASGVILLLGIEHAPIVFLAVRAGLRMVPADVVEAARMAGAGSLRANLTVVLPLLRPSLLAGAALAFVSSIGNFGVPAILGIPGRYTLLTTLIYQRLNGFGPSMLGQIAILALLLAILAAAGLAIQALALRGRTAAAPPGRPLEPHRLGRWRLPVEIVIGLLLVAIAILPLAGLLSSAVAQAVGVPVAFDTMTLRHFAFALGSEITGRAFANSLGLALAAAGLSAAAAIPLAYLLAIRRRRLAAWLNAVADAPYALPGIVLSIACILLYLQRLPLLDFSLYNSFAILLVAYLGRFLALALRPTLAGLQGVDPALDEAGAMAGAGLFTRLKTVIAPLVAPAAAAGAMLVFMAAFNELTVSALLWSAGNETLGVVIFALYDEGNSNAAAAVSTLTLAVTLALAGLAQLCARRLPPGVLPWQP